MTKAKKPVTNSLRIGAVGALVGALFGPKVMYIFEVVTGVLNGAQ